MPYTVNMPALFKILSVVFPVFSIIGSGYCFARFKKISLEPIIDLLLYLTIPALVVSSLLKKKLVMGDLGYVGVAAVAVCLGTGLISLVYLRIIKRTDLRGFYLPTMFMNAGNMSFPLSLLAFGADGLAVSVLYYIAVGLMVYSLGIYIAKGKGGLAEIFRLPLIYASVAGIALNLGEVPVPEPVIGTLDMLGAATIPVMQISLGYKLYSTRISQLGVSTAGSVIRLGGGVLVAWLVVTLLHIDGLNAKIIILSSAMPSAVINFVVSHRYNVNSDLVASIVALSTVLSLITTPLVLLWIM